MYFNSIDIYRGQSEISDWVRKAIVHGFQSLRALLPQFRPKKKTSQSTSLPPIKDAVHSLVDKDK